MEYLRNNLYKGFLVSPLHAPAKSWLMVPVYALIAVSIGFASGLLKFEIIKSNIVFVLPVTLFVFPSLLEEAFFRGVLIHREILAKGKSKTAIAIFFSTVAFVAWHPFNAYLINHSAISLFTNPWFLVIVFWLGLTCGYGYVVSQSIWVPVIIHWLTVLIWVFFLGGRNLVLAQ
ncbi:MAG TPA: CPBP family glutamic-type intramembrane protease [Desulfobacterales bacterium]|nr:CPBP family glutamic-type intramembrane protease [Desulfobacterales bacterium]